MAGRRRIRRVRKGQLALFRIMILIILGSLCLFYFIQSPFWSLTTVEVEGNYFVSSEEITQVSGILLDTNIFKLDLEQAKNHILLHPIIKQVQFSRKLPGTLIIKIKERTPKAILPGSGQFFEIDEQGVILRAISTVSDVELPLITGLDMEGLGPGEKIPNPHLGEALSLIKLLPSDLLSRVSEMDLSSPGTVFLHVLDGFQVNFGSGDRIEEKIQLLSEIFTSSEIKIGELEYVDLSFAGPPVIKLGN